MSDFMLHFPGDEEFMLGASLEAALKNGYVKNQKEYFYLRKLYQTLLELVVANVFVTHCGDASCMLCADK
jgi:hypothetical protein